MPDKFKTVNESFTVNGTAIILINEAGVYKLAMRSKLPNALKNVAANLRYRVKKMACVWTPV